MIPIWKLMVRCGKYLEYYYLVWSITMIVIKLYICFSHFFLAKLLLAVIWKQKTESHNSESNKEHLHNMKKMAPKSFTRGLGLNTG